MATALVYGWYGRGNAGDELMRLALINMFKPRGLTLSFVDQISAGHLIDLETNEFVDAVIFGGGSILFGAPDITPDALNTLLQGNVVPVFYVGVGGETQINPVHQKLIDVAKLVYFRELDMPDLAYSLEDPSHVISHEPHGLVVIPNVETLPTWQDPHWKHIAWERFKDEFAQALDQLADGGLEISFLLMCSNPAMEDAWSAAELMGRMKRRALVRRVFAGANIDTLTMLRRNKAIVTQRYHGIIMAEMAGVPYVSIDHHDKLRLAKPSRGRHIAYHAARKDELIESITEALSSKLEPHKVPKSTYDDIADKIIKEISLVDRSTR